MSEFMGAEGFGAIRVMEVLACHDEISDPSQGIVMHTNTLSHS